MTPEAVKRRKRSQRTFVVKPSVDAGHRSRLFSVIHIGGRKLKVVKTLRNGALICREELS